MVKQGRHRQKSIVFVVLVVFGSTLFSACGGSTSNGSSTSSLTPINQLGTYSSPSWWHDQDCNKGSYSAAYSLLGYNQDGTPKTWRGIEVCGPTGNKPGPEEGFPGASQYMFQCTELVARYLLGANKLQSQIADGKDIVNVY